MKKFFTSFHRVLPVPINLKIFSAGVTFLSNIIFAKMFNAPSPRGPLFVTWLATFDCNAYCSFCATHTLKKRLPDALSRERAIEVAHEIGRAGTFAVGFSGGETLLWPYQFDVIHALKQHRVVTYIVTNGLLLRENADAILEHQVDYIVVSLDTYHAEEHNKLRNVPELFERAIEGIEYLKRKRKGRRPLIKSTTILSRKTLPQMADILDRLEQVVDVTSIQPIMYGFDRSPHARDKESLGDLVFPEDEEQKVTAQMDSLIQSRPEFNNTYFKLIPTYWFHREALIQKYHCWSPFLRIQIMPNGDVSHCHVNPKYSTIGNLNQSSLMEIWNNVEFRRQREEIRRHENACICWDQSAALNIFLDSLPILNRLPLLNKTSQDSKRKPA